MQTTTHEPAYAVRFIVLCIVLSFGIVIGAALTTAGSARADDAPYGGCRELAQDLPTMAHSYGGDWCRAHGWTVKPRLLVNRHGVVKVSTLPECVNEDGSGQKSACTWNLDNPPKDGADHWVGRDDTVHYVWSSSPLVEGWHWSNHKQSKALGRHDCIVKDGTTVSSGMVARCPG